MAEGKKPAFRVGIWIRVSTPDQAQGESPEHHLIRAKQYAASNGWAVMEVYDLAGVSGKTVWNHPECQRMLNDVRRGHIQGLIFSKLARLARNTVELLNFCDYFEQRKAHLISLEEKFDTSNAAGRLFFTFIGAIANWERDEIASRIRASISVRAKLGKPLGGKSPYGFKWQNKKLVSVPEEAQIRRLAYELFLEHHRKGAVARLLNEKGYRTRDGKKFRDMNIRRMLECSSAIGLYRTNQWKAVKGGRELKNEEEWGTVECEPIVTGEIYRQTCEVLEHQIKPARKPGKKPVSVFAGLLRCGCGGKLYVYTRSPNYTCQKCKNKISIETIDGLFLETLTDELGNPGKMASHMEKTRRKITEREAELSIVRRKIEQAQAEMRKVLELYLEGGVTVDRFKQINEPLEERLAQLTASQPRLEGEITALEINSVSSDAAAREGRDIAQIWPTLNDEEKQRVAHLLCTEILIPVNPEELVKMSFTTSQNGTEPSSNHNTQNPSGSGGGKDDPDSGNGHRGIPFTPPPHPDSGAPGHVIPGNPASSGYADNSVKIPPPSGLTPSPDRIFNSLSRLITHRNLVVERSDTTGFES